MKTGIFLGLVGCALFAPMLCATTTFNFTTQSTTPTITSGNGNTICYSSGGTELSSCSGSPYLKISAWSTTGSGGALAGAGLGQYSGTGFGLGVCNSVEMTGGCAAPQHEVDNNGQLDFVLFQFSSTLSGQFSFLLNSVCQCDTDASYWYGTNGAVSGKTVPSGVNGILGTEHDDLYGGPTAPPYSRNLSFSANGITTILLGGYVGSTNDYFKIGGLTYTPGSSVPEPISFVLAGSGLIGMYLGRRRGKNKA